MPDALRNTTSNISEDVEVDEDVESVPLLSKPRPVSDNISASKRADVDKPASVWATALKAITLAVSYILVSAGMILFNKFLMQPDRFPFATSLTTLHMLNALFLASLLHRLAPSLFPTFDAVWGTGKKDVRAVMTTLMPFSVIAVCGAMSLVAGNTAYKYSSVAFLQMVKESHIIFVYALMVVFGLETLRLKTVCILTFIAISAAFAVYGEVHFALYGLCLQLFAGLSGSAQIVLSNRLMSKSGGPKLDPLTMVFCTSPTMLIALIPANFQFWDPMIPERAYAMWPYLVANMLLAFLLQLVTAMTIKGISATGHALSSVLKDLAIVTSAAVIFHESLSTIQILGFAGTIAGIAIYSSMKLFPEYFGLAPPQATIKK